MNTLFGILFVSIFGTLLHFMYEWSNHKKIVSIFAAVNESTWEHIKIALIPSFVWMFYDGAIYGLEPNYFVAKTASLLAIIIIIPVLFYAYQIFTKKTMLPIDIIIFYIAIIVSNLLFNYIIYLKPFSFFITYFAVIILFIIFGFLMVATLMPIKNFIFKDPITKKYGVKGHSHSH